jgi:hypothetical protein
MVMVEWNRAESDANNSRADQWDYNSYQSDITFAIEDKGFESKWAGFIQGPTVPGLTTSSWPPGTYRLEMTAMVFKTVEDKLMFHGEKLRNKIGFIEALAARPPIALFPAWTQAFVVQASGLAELRPCEWVTADPRPKPVGLEVEYSHLRECTSCKQTWVSAISPGFSALRSKSSESSDSARHGSEAYESIGSGALQLLVDDFAIDLAASHNIVRHMAVATVQARPVMTAEVGKEVSRLALRELKRRGDYEVNSVEFPGSVLQLNGTLQAWYIGMSTGVCYAISYDHGQSWVKPSIQEDGSNYIFVRNATETRLLSGEVSVTFDSAQRMYLMTYCQADDQTVRLLRSEDGMNWYQALQSVCCRAAPSASTQVTAGGARTWGSWWAEAAIVRSPWCRWATPVQECW